MNFFPELNEYIPQLKSLLGYLGLISLLTFSLSVIVIPLIINRLSVNYFINLTQPEHSGHQKPGYLSHLILFVRNFIGLLLLMAGLLMLFLPGQGLLTILIGVAVMSIPGKYKLIAVIISNESVQNSLNWLRKKNGKQPFRWPQKE